MTGQVFRIILICHQKLLAVKMKSICACRADCIGLPACMDVIVIACLLYISRIIQDHLSILHKSRTGIHTMTVKRLIRSKGRSFKAPVKQIAAAGVAEIVIGRTVAGVSPDPRKMKKSVRAGDRTEKIGVHPSASGSQRLFEKPRPAMRTGIVNVIDFIAAAADSVSIVEDHAAVRGGEKTGIGAFLFAVPDQRGHADNGIRIVRTFHPEVDQRDRVHVRRDMQTPG